MAQKDTYDFETKQVYHQALQEAARQSIRGQKPSKLVAVCFGAHELLEVKRVLLPNGYDPRNIYSIECHKPTLEKALETNARDAIGMPEENFLCGYDWKVFEKMIRGEEGVPHRKINYLNLDYQGPVTKDKMYAMALVFGGQLLAPLSLFASNFLSGRERTGHDTYSGLLEHYELMDQVNQSRGLQIDEVIAAQDSVYNSTLENPMGEKRDWALTRLLLGLSRGGKSHLGLTTGFRNYLSWYAKSPDKDIME